LEQVSTSPPLIRRSAIATNVLLIINIALYTALEWSGGPTYENLVRYGAKENGLIASGEWYRLFSPHASWL
jgi:rhomboid protease GluP